MFLALLLVGCTLTPQKPTACYKLEMCKVKLHGDTLDQAFHPDPTFNVYCVCGYDAAGNKNGEVQRFLTNDAISAWSQFHPEAKGCE